MKRLICASSIILAGTLSAWAADPAPLRTLHEIHKLTNSEASHLLPVAFEATVVYFGGRDSDLFVQDGDMGIYVYPPLGTVFVPGDRVLIKGVTRPSFRPTVAASSIQLLHRGDRPQPLPATFDRLISAQFDCLLVRVQGVVQTVDPIQNGNVHLIALRLLTDGGYVDAQVLSDDPSALNGLMDAEVEAVGAAAGRFDGKMQQTGVRLHIISPADVKVLKRATVDPWSIPLVPMDQVLLSSHVNNLTRRVRVRGTITYYQPGVAVVLQNGDKSLWIATQSTTPLRLGDRADATGFPEARDGFLTLTNGEVLDRQISMPVKPQAEAWQQLVTSRHLFDLVSIEGKVVTAVRGNSQDEYALVSDGYMFSAIYRHPATGSAGPLAPMKQVPVGSRVRVTGICVLNDSNPFDHDVAFEILLRSPDDVEIVARPSWLNVRNLMLAVSMLGLLVVAVGLWGWTLRKRVQRQTTALSCRIAVEAAMERRMAQLEQRRSRILEDINGVEPLAGILERITELVSFHLAGAACWCEVAGGARLGNFPRDTSSLSVIESEIPARSGPALGRLFAALASGTGSLAEGAEALALGSRLATLAIETRRLYSDLRHRSEFDLLTDVHNRFSLEKLLDANIEEARENARIFGLIFIDLDRFKQVNDVYGHLIGDMYLQEVSARMKHQLRSADTLARLGGDEFAALVPVVHSRQEVEEIADRLERCFDEPYQLEGCTVFGSASVGIALYPEDGSTRDKLLSAADAAMYVAKRIRRQVTEEEHDLEPAQEKRA